MVAQERLEPRPDGLVRITLKKAYTDGTVAVDMDPLSLLCRLATRVPPPRFHTVRHAGVLAAASPWRPRIAPKPPTEEPAACSMPDVELGEPEGRWLAAGQAASGELPSGACADGDSSARRATSARRSNSRPGDGHAVGAQGARGAFVSPGRP